MEIMAWVTSALDSLVKITSKVEFISFTKIVLKDTLLCADRQLNNCHRLPEDDLRILKKIKKLLMRIWFFPKAKKALNLIEDSENKKLPVHFILSDILILFKIRGSKA